MNSSESKTNEVEELCHGECTIDYMPWRTMTPEQKIDQESWQAVLREKHAMAMGDECFISRLAMVHPDTMEMGDRCFIAAGAIVRDTDLIMGCDCTVNSYAVLVGKITMGKGVRIASHASILGFNHGFSDLTRP